MKLLTKSMFGFDDLRDRNEESQFTQEEYSSVSIFKTKKLPFILWHRNKTIEMNNRSFYYHGNNISLCLANKLTDAKWCVQLGGTRLYNIDTLLLKLFF